MRNKIKDLLLTVAVAFVTLFAVTTCRGLTDGKNYLKRGDEAYQNNKPEEALRYWRRSARWYLPFANHDDQAYVNMQKLVKSARDANNVKLELKALRGIRNSVWATRSVVRPHQELLPATNQRIAEIMAAIENPKIDPEKTIEERKAWHLAALREENSPHRGWTFIAAIGFMVWLLSVFYFVKRGLDKNERLQVRVTLYCGVSFCVGLGVWLLGLWMA